MRAPVRRRMLEAVAEDVEEEEVVAASWCVPSRRVVVVSLSCRFHR